jgi:tetratricopeptide (TPR) repeat protein
VSALPQTRRIATAGTALVLAFGLFRGQLAAAVVTRGDDVLRTGDVGGALRFYRRALLLDRFSTTAADRLAFHLALRHNEVDARSAIEIADAALRATPSSAPLFADRAFAEVQLRAWPAAERDFARAGDLGHDVRYEHFASRIALRRGEPEAARAFARRALAWDPAFAPARTLLRHLQ